VDAREAIAMYRAMHMYTECIRSEWTIAMTNVDDGNPGAGLDELHRLGLRRTRNERRRRRVRAAMPRALTSGMAALRKMQRRHGRRTPVHERDRA